ncbi:MAG: FoF1 ATP synthase subunit a [Candidatus Melainabacteria bacterium]|nr:FoF1 ATP synthase subunit a [Candidatus Melainabacteria bacterium]
MLDKHLHTSQFEALKPIADISTPFGPMATVHVDTMLSSWACMIFVLVLALVVRPQLTSTGPGGTGQAIAESIYTFLDDLCKGQIGHDYKKFLPLIAAIFIFVLTGNLFGILPWALLTAIPGYPHLPNGHGHFEVASPTTDINVTAGLAVIALVTYIYAGIQKHGMHYIGMYFKPLGLIEWMDLIIRPVTLALRLLLVITADELTRMVALMLLPWIVAPVAVMGFEIFIAFLQAFVFALLTSIYIGLAVADHH